jgi:excisionase family DNA binding protein
MANSVHHLPGSKGRDKRRLIDVTVDEVVDAVVAQLREVIRREPEPEVLTTLQLAKRFGVSKDTVYRWIREGCPHFKVGDKDYRFRYDKVLAWKEEKGDD